MCVQKCVSLFRPYCACVCVLCWLLPVDHRHVEVVEAAARSFCIITKSYVLPCSPDGAGGTVTKTYQITTLFYLF